MASVAKYNKRNGTASSKDEMEDDFDIDTDKGRQVSSSQPQIFSPKKSPAKPVYRHKWNSNDDDGDKLEESAPRPVTTTVPFPKKTVSDSELLQTSEQKKKFFTTKLKRTVTQPTKPFDEPVSQIKCRREDKEMYTVVRNVKQAHQCREWGEAQEFTDDMDYYLSSLLGTKENTVKYLSVTTLAQKCVSANFRNHLRAQGFVKKLFNALSDCYTDPTLALCTACVFYLLSRDRSSISIDESTLSLALKLMEVDEPTTTDEAGDYRKYKQKLYQILNDWHKTVQNAVTTGQNVLFDVTEDNLTTNFLITEALVFVFLRTQHESFKLSMCRLGGLDLIVKLLDKEVACLSSQTKRVDDANFIRFKLLERYLRILEQSTHECSRNQAYLITLDDSLVLTSLVRLFSFCHSMIPSIYKSSLQPSPRKSGRSTASSFSPKVLLDTTSSCLKVLCNLSHLNELCCTKLSRMKGFIEGCVEFVTSTIPCYLSVDDRFDLSTLTLGLLVNLVEPCNVNRRTAINAVIPYKTTSDSVAVQTKAVDALIKMFLKHEAAAEAINDEVDRQIDSCSQELKGSAEEVSQQIHETLEVAVSHAGRHMEDCIISSYIALFIGLMLQQNEDVADDIKLLLNTRSFEPMVAMLKKFMEFLKLINKMTSSCEKSMCSAMELLESLI